MAEVSLNRTKRISALSLPTIDVTRAGLIIACVFLLGAAFVGTTDPDYFWHLRTGQLIVDNLAVPMTDPFSFTKEGADWVAHEWLGEVIIYGAVSTGGYGLALAIFATVALGALLLTYRTSLSLGASRNAAMVFFVWAGVMTFRYWTVRPQAFTWLFFAAFIAICLEHKSGRANRLWLLPMLTILWANLHLGVMFGLAVVGLYALSQTLERFVWKQEVDLKSIYLALGASVLATLVNPNPLELLLYPLQYIEPGNTNVELIAEWQSPNFHDAAFFPLALAMFALVGMGCLWATPRPVPANAGVAVRLPDPAVGTQPAAVCHCFHADSVTTRFATVGMGLRFGSAVASKATYDIELDAGQCLHGAHRSLRRDLANTSAAL